MICPKAASTIASSKLKLPLFVPSEPTSDVLRFCQRLASGVPTLLSVTPLKGSLPLQCYFNVKLHSQLQLGSPRFGWLIWQFADFWLEAHHHAVWQREDGNIVDVTPQPDGEMRVMFLPDPARPFDFVKPKPFCRQRASLSAIPEIKAWVDALNTLDKFVWQHSRFVGEEVEVRVIGDHDVRRYDRLRSEVGRTEKAAHDMVTKK